MVEDVVCGANEDDDAVSRHPTQLNGLGDDAPPAAFVKLARACEARLADDEAEAAIRSGLDRYPDNRTLMTNFANLARKAKDWHEAKVRYTAVLNTHPTEAPAREYNRLAEACSRLGALDDAEAAIRLGLERHPTDLPLRTAFAELAWRARQWDNTVSRCRAMLNGNGDGVPAVIYLRMAQALHMTGQVDEADAVVNEGLARHPGNLLLRTQFPWQRLWPAHITKTAKSHWRRGLSADETFALEVECLTRLQRQPDSRAHFPRLVSTDSRSRELSLEFKGISLKCLSELGLRRDVFDLEGQVGRMIRALEGANVVHLDAQPDNMVIDSHGHMSLIDFGISVIDASPRNAIVAEELAVFQESGGYRHLGERLRNYIAEACNIRR